MVSGKTLLTRIHEAGKTPALGRRLEEDPKETLAAVMLHLQDLFNVRQGSAMTCPEYGLPDFNDLVHSSPLTMETELAKAIKEAIRRYEPRLMAVRVRHVPDEHNPLNLAFQISARLTVGDKKRPVSFETIMTESGRIRVRE